MEVENWKKFHVFQLARLMSQFFLCLTTKFFILRDFYIIIKVLIKNSTVREKCRGRCHEL